MELNKPYVWVIPSESQQPQLKIRCNCGAYRALNIDVAVESSDEDRYIIEIPFGSAENPPEVFSYTTANYTSRHTKITVRVMDGATIRGSCTVKPDVDFFF
ncbi:MAG TPA: hypothetical protein VJY62_16305 [Bacteroidia bacterium]|nr:hypothetical protein [Bacteroidia bacterium]